MEHTEFTHRAIEMILRGIRERDEWDEAEEMRSDEMEDMARLATAN